MDRSVRRFVCPHEASSTLGIWQDITRLCWHLASCNLRFPVWENVRLQKLQMYGRSPVWHLECLWSLYLVAKNLPHSLQLRERSISLSAEFSKSMWKLIMWDFKETLKRNDWWQFAQRNSFLPWWLSLCLVKTSCWLNDIVQIWRHEKTAIKLRTEHDFF